MTSDAEGSFRSHANYLRALATLVGHSTVPKVSRARAMAGQKAAVLASTSLNDKPHEVSEVDEQLSSSSISPPADARSSLRSAEEADPGTSTRGR